ncbi:hypothetical protein SBV1_260009 [Verrucomicrobia bacterium]|nr:hypothetical protein SBV1_260009 [Verrucomicrobiota bacterium]
MLATKTTLPPVCWRDSGTRRLSFQGSPLSLLRMHWDHEPGRENGTLCPTLSPSEGTREKRRTRASRIARFMENV